MTAIRKVLNCRVEPIVCEGYIWYRLLDRKYHGQWTKMCNLIVHSVDSSQFNMNFVWNSMTCMNASPLKAGRTCQGRLDLIGDDCRPSFTVCMPL